MADQAGDGGSARRRSGCRSLILRRVVALSLALVLLAAACTSGEPEREGSEPVRPSASPSPVVTADVESQSCGEIARLVGRVKRGRVPGASPDLLLIPREPNYIGSAAEPVHSGPWDYLAEVPLVAYGQGLNRLGRTDRPASMADLAETTARLIDFNWRGGRGKSLDELVGPGRAPRLIVSIVWDGGGWNVLRMHEESWPHLARLMDKGAVYTNFTIGSSPSVTPPVHTTLGTGVYPSRHGIPGLRTRTAEGEYIDPFIGLDPTNIRVRTLADDYDLARDNRPVTGMFASVNWHLGMIGQGAGIPGADKDPVALLDDEGDLFTNPSLYELPPVSDPTLLDAIADELDDKDGAADGEWRGHPLDDPIVRYASPAHVDYQQRLLERFIVAERFGEDRVPDLLYVNFKSLDDSGHNWGPDSKETGEVLKATDDALKRLTAFLDDKVGRDEWALLVTADHGQTLFPEDSGGFAIGGAQLADDLNREFDDDGGPGLIDRVSSPGAYLNLNRADFEVSDTKLKEMAEWLVHYTAAENVKEGEDFPAYYQGAPNDPLFDAVVYAGGVATRDC